MIRVLLVDDNDCQRKLSRVLLEDAGYEVDATSGALDALSAARAHAPDVIVSDVMMDQVDGFGLCRRLQEDAQLARIPIVLVSAGYDDAESQRLARALGASALIRRTPDFSAELAGIASCTETKPPAPLGGTRRSYEAHLEANARQLTKQVAQTQRAELRWRTLFEHAHDALMLLTPAGIIVEANHRWFDALGIAPRALIGTHFAQYAASGGEEPNRAAFEDLLVRGSTRVMFALRHVTGTTVYMEVGARVIEVDGTDHIIAICRDTTEQVLAARKLAAAEAQRRQLEERLAHGQRLETIGQLTGGIAHDFNNVLSTILANAEFLLEDLAPSDPRRTDAADIRDAARRATGLARQLLAFSRRQVLELVDLDVGSVVRSVSRMLQRVLGANIAMTIDEAPGLGLVRADLVQLEQVIVNLVVNARDAMPVGGELVLATREVVVDEPDGVVPRGRYVVLAVTDTGCGMTEETKRRVFEPFFTTKDATTGTGLGLSTSFGIVKQLGGEIVIDSVLGSGTTMSVYLPRKA